MARKVAQELRYCNNCGRDTLHLKNTKEMSWLMHIGLTIITGGLWMAFWIATAIFHGMTKPIGDKNKGWACSVCGGKKQGSTPDTHVRCPDCRELVLKNARVCKHCGCKLVPQT